MSIGVNGHAVAIATGFLFGGAAGYLIGVLTAPASGEATRNELRAKARSGRRELLRGGQRVIDRAAHGLENGIERGRRRLSGALAR